jgi:hypothetical protein
MGTRENLPDDDTTPDHLEMVGKTTVASEFELGEEEDIEIAGTAPDDETVRDRQPKGDHNRRLALGLDVDEFAAIARVTPDELREYESTWPDHEFSMAVARKVGIALERLEADPPLTQKVINGPSA